MIQPQVAESDVGAGVGAELDVVDNGIGKSLAVMLSEWKAARDEAQEAQQRVGAQLLAAGLQEYAEYAEPADVWGITDDEDDSDEDELDDLFGTDDFDDSDLQQTLRFDLKNPEVLTWLDARAGELVRQITEGQRTLIQDILHDSFVKGLTPTATAVRLRQVIGLTSQQGGYVENYHAKLMQQGVNEFKAKDLTEKYRANWVRYRANTIARTETIAASAEGQAQVWQQATTLGYLDPEEFEETWIIAPDRITCPECRELDGKRWPIGQGPKPPRHPGCRCSRGIVRKGTGPARTVALPDYVPRDNVYKLQPKVPASAVKASEPSALALLKRAYYSKYSALQSWSGAWDEAKHPRADNGEFGSGSAKDAQPDKPWLTDVTPEQQENLYDYQSMGSAANEHLRDAVKAGLKPNGWVLEKVNKMIPELDALFATSPAPHDTTVWRGIDSSLVQHLTPGVQYTDKAYTSTALDRETSELYADERGGALLRISVPKGEPAVSIKPGLYRSEVLLARDSTFTVKAVNTEGGMKVIDVEYKHA